MTLLFVSVCLHVVLLSIVEDLQWYFIPKPGLLVSRPEKNLRTHNYIPCVAMSKHNSTWMSMKLTPDPL